MTSTEPGPRLLPADPFHAKVRLGALGLWLVIVILVYGLGYTIFQLMLGQDIVGLWFPLLIGALLLSQPLARLAEPQLVRLLPSGRAVSLESGALVMREKSGAALFDLKSGAVNYWRWYFKTNSSS